MLHTLNFFSGNEEAKEDEAHYTSRRDGQPTQRRIDLEWQSQVVYYRDKPKVNRIRERDGRGENALETGERICQLVDGRD